MVAMAGYLPVAVFIRLASSKFQATLAMEAVRIF